MDKLKELVAQWRGEVEFNREQRNIESLDYMQGWYAKGSAMAERVANELEAIIKEMESEL